MTDAVDARLDVPYGQQPETKALAARRVAREEEADMLLDMLGLTGDDQPSRPTCPICEQPLSKGKHGGYRPCQRKTCREVSGE